MNEIAIVLTLDTEGPSAGKDGLAPDWPSVEKLITALDTTIRQKLIDSHGNPAVYSWFLLDWVGITPKNSEALRRNTQLGHHTVFDWYRERILHDEHIQKTGDRFYWHYHHPFSDGSWGWNTDWGSNRMYEDVINRKVAERGFYPTVYAAGGYVMTNESSQWLDRWVPFDFSSNAPVKTDSYDWSRAPLSWLPYHPSADDYQRPGDMKRYLTLRKPTAGHYSALSEDDVHIAFKEAQSGKRPILSVISHDYMESCADEFTALYKTLESLSRTYPEVTWRNRTALDAMRWSLGLSDPGDLDLEIAFEAEGISIEFSHAIFSPVPWVVRQLHSGEYERVDSEVLEEGRRYRIPRDSVYVVGATDFYGNVCFRKVAQGQD